MKEDYPFPDEALKTIIGFYPGKKIELEERQAIIDVLFDYIELKIFYQRSKINTLLNYENEEKFLKGFAYKPTERVKKILLMQNKIEETIELRDIYIRELEHWNGLT